LEEIKILNWERHKIKQKNKIKKSNPIAAEQIRSFLALEKLSVVSPEN
jgi:hypothetical protein